MRFDHQRRLPSPKRQGTIRAYATAGYSLIEVLIVVSVLGVLTSVAVPTMLTARRGFNLSTAGTTVANRLGEARMEAIKRNRAMNVVLDAASRTLFIRMIDPGPVVVTLATEVLPSDVDLDLGGNPNMTIGIDSLGRPLNPPQTFTIRHPQLDQFRTLTVLSTGRIAITQD
jgi:prepilin-type N-terminal cleavage/methylation domain-containing protein